MVVDGITALHPSWPCSREVCYTMDRSDKNQTKPLTDRSRFAQADLRTLVNLARTPGQSPDVLADIIAEFSRLSAPSRSENLAMILRTLLKDSQRYGDLITSIIELLATDPNPSATEAMLDLLPVVTHGDTTLVDDQREYFYEALLTRRRDTDLPEWRASMPRLDADTLVALAVDPLAESFRAAVNPMKYIEALPDAERRKALTAIAMRNPGQAMKRLFKRK
jgi:hypothetical protein